MPSIRDVLRNRVILLTGGTGFLGKALQEKILRAVPDVGRVYVLVRGRKRPDGTEMAPGERLRREIFETAIFSRLRQQHGERFNAFIDDKVVAVAGDLRHDGLGMSDDTVAKLRDEVDVIIHGAASVFFDERIDHAVQMNTLGPKRLLDLALTFRTKPLFCFVSTCYVCGASTGSVPELPPPPGWTPGGEQLDVSQELAEIEVSTKAIHERARSAEVTAQCRQEATRRPAAESASIGVDDLIEQARERWLVKQLVDEGMRRARRFGWHEVYTFTKSMGEALVAKHRGDMPVALVRPSIIESSFAEPEPGWINGLKVADPLIAGYAKGRIPDFPGRREAVLDIIPVDFVANTILAAVHRLDREGGIAAYHIATGARNPITVQRMFELMQSYYRRHPMRDKRGEPIRARDWQFPNTKWFRARYHFGYLLPLRAGAALARATPFLPWPTGIADKFERGARAVERLLYYIDIYGPYTNLQCTFESTNTKRMFDDLDEDDKKAFNFDVEALDWPVYIQDIHLSGLDRHVLRFGRPPGSEGGKNDARVSTEDLRTLPDLVRISADRFGDKVALQIKRNGSWQRVTYRELLQRAGNMGALWRAMGLGRGQRIVLISENQPEWAIAYMAAQSIGATVVPIDSHTPATEIEEIVAFTAARAVIASSATYTHLPKSLRSSPLPVLDLSEGGRPFSDSGSAPTDIRPVVWEELSPDDTASIIFTSGPAVDPRGAMLTHRNFLANLLALSEVLRSYETDRFVSVLPLHHALEFTGGLLMPLFSGATVTYAQNLKSNVILETMRETGATALLAVPRILEMLLDRLRRASQQASAGERNEELDAFVNQTRLLVSGGAPLDISIYEGFVELGFEIHEGYGLTETAPILTVNPLWAVRPRSVGKPLPGVELFIEPPDVPGDYEPGEGEIVVRGPNLMKGYFGNPETTATVLRDGKLYTGDIGRLDSDGYLTITGRSKELIVTGAGKNVWPEEVELFYKSLEGVEEMAVYGVREPNATREIVHGAFRVSGDADQVLERVHRVAHERPSYQRIQQVHIWAEALPRRDDGRVDRRALRDATIDILKTAKKNKRRRRNEPQEMTWWQRDTLNLMTRIAVRESDDGVMPREQLTQLYDSLQLLELVTTLESRFGIAITEEHAASMRSVQDVLDEVGTVVGSRAEPPPDELDEPIDSDYWANALAAADAAGPPATVATSSASGPLRSVFLGASAGVLHTAFQLSVRGADRLPRDRPYLIAANHSSHLDTIAMMTAMRGQVERLHILGARDYFFDTPAKAWFFRNVLSVVPFDREKNFVDGMRACRAVLRPREPVLIFPEGTRSPSGRLQPFKVGLGILALELGAAVVPARIRGTYEAMPKGTSFPRPHRIEVAFGEPVEMAPFHDQRRELNHYALYREIVNQTRQRIEQLLEEG